MLIARISGYLTGCSLNIQTSLVLGNDNACQVLTDLDPGKLQGFCSFSGSRGNGSEEGWFLGSVIHLETRNRLGGSQFPEVV